MENKKFLYIGLCLLCLEYGIWVGLDSKSGYWQLLISGLFFILGVAVYKLAKKISKELRDG
jgi:hypothetical protein